MKKLITIIKVYISICALIYIIDVYSKWVFYNPFWRIYEIPYDSSIRRILLGTTVFTVIIGFVLYKLFLDKNGKLNLK